MTSQAGVFDGEVNQVFIWQTSVDNFSEFRSGLVREVSSEPFHHVYVMHIVAGHTAHVAAVMLAALPIEMASIRRMAGEAGLIDLRRGDFAGIDSSFC